MVDGGEGQEMWHHGMRQEANVVRHQSLPRYRSAKSSCGPRLGVGPHFSQRAYDRLLPAAVIHSFPIAFTQRNPISPYADTTHPATNPPHSECCSPHIPHSSRRAIYSRRLSSGCLLACRLRQSPLTPPRHSFPSSACRSFSYTRLFLLKAVLHVEERCRNRKIGIKVGRRGEDVEQKP